MACARAPTTSPPATLSDDLHPSLIRIAAVIEQSERDRKQRLNLAQELLGTINTWAKTKAGTEDGAVLAPLIESLAPIVTAFAIGTAQFHESPCKTPYPKKSVVTAAASRVTKAAEKPIHDLPEKPQINKQSWITVVKKAAKLPEPPAALMTPKHTKTPPERPKKEDKRLFLRLSKDHEWRKLSPLSIKKIITQRAGIAASAIVEMYQVRSGMAFECVSDALRESILRVASSFQKENAKIEPASEWSSFLVPNVPIHIRSLEGNRIVNTLVTDEMVAKECPTVAGAGESLLRTLPNAAPYLGHKYFR